MKSLNSEIFVKIISKTKTRDPIYIFFNRISKSKAITVSIVVGIIQICLWIGVSNIVENRYPGQDLVYFYDLDEFTFGFFLWGIFVPILWWYYLSLPKMWEKTAKALKKADLVSKKIVKIIPQRSYTLISLFFALLAGTIYRFSTIPAEIASGRVSFWFVAEWTRIIITLIVTINAYIFINFVLDTLLLSYRMRSFFNKNGVSYIQVFHIDGCGGFGVVGSLAMKISSLIVVVGVWAAWFSLLPWLAGGAVNFDFSVLIVYFVYIVFVPLLLFLLTWPVHKAMRKYKLNFQGRICSQLEDTFNAIADSTFELQGNHDELDQDLDRYKYLLQLCEKVETIPEWPISLRSFQRFTGFASLPGIIGFVSFVFDIVDFSKAFD